MAKVIGTFSGVGESKVFAADVAENDSRWDSVTLNGQPIPDHLRAAIPWSMTDQGYAENNAGKEKARVQIVREERDNEIGRRAEDLMRMAPEDSAMASDPLRDRARQHVAADKTPRWLSKKRVDSEAGNTRGYEIVKDKQTGQPVQFGNMVLGQIPTDIYVDRRAQAAVRSRQQLEQVKQAQAAAELKPA